MDDVLQCLGGSSLLLAGRLLSPPLQLAARASPLLLSRSRLLLSSPLLLFFDISKNL
jgi:hypothetical protein